MTDPNSPDIQAIFAQLHALGVTPEQGALPIVLRDRFLSIYPELAAFYDYPDLPRGPLSPEVLASLERLKETAKRLDIRIEVPKRGHSGEVVDCPITLHRERTDGPLVVTVLKNRHRTGGTVPDTFGARGPDFAELEARAIERMTDLSKEPPP